MESYMSEPVSSDDIAEILLDEIDEVNALNENGFIQEVHEKLFQFDALGDIKYPYTCYQVQGQKERACKLTSPSDLPSEIKHIYKIDYGLTNVYGTEKGLLTGVQACVYSVNGKSGTVTVTGMSSMKFANTRSGRSPHNTGKAFDVKLAGRMMSDGSGYDKVACAYLCLYCVEAGSTRVYFSDKEVIDAVNKATNKTVCEYLGGHKNHIHMHNYS